VELDLALLERFLSSPVGRELFAEGITAYPEAPFQWRVGGTVLFGVMDRLLRRADGTWVVVDYKSSILEESRERYRFQVESYMAAVAEYARGQGEANPRVLGYLVDLYETKAYPVETAPAAAALRIGEEIEQVKANYTLPVEKLSGPSPGARAGAHCFSCAYLYHCDLGKEFANLTR
jgi:CRISPR/Cas system-associated exonuclease Cas4 (RecB family)